jgi:NAD-dependent SIR2 family protein deacetylase
MNNNNSYHSFILNFLSNIDSDIDNSKLAIFVGSGVSICSGYPKWSDVIKKFAEPLGISKDKLEERDYLEIPDKFFYKFRHFEYKKLLNDIFDLQYTNLDLQEKILQINPYHVITTNWDNLLETAMLQTENRYYDIVHNDNDLSKANNTKLIIKMHGSLLKLDNDNNAIVMKESDYASYSDNFPLIENYIKSIFSTKRVFFIGYSLSDRNVQQILHWVKNRTINHIFPYLLIDGAYDEIEFSFYKEKGVFLLYCDEILNFLGKSTIADYQEKYASVLNLIMYRKNYLQDNKSLIEKFYNSLKTYEQFHFLSIDIIRDIIKNEFDIHSNYGIFGDRVLYLSIVGEYPKQELVKLFETINRLAIAMKSKKYFKPKINEKEAYILEKIDESNIETIALDFNKKISVDLSLLYELITNAETFNLFQTLIDFDFNGALNYTHEEMTSNTKVSDHNKIKLFKAYILYKIEKYDEAIIILQDVQKNSYQNKDFYIYFIAKTNLKYICHIKNINIDNESNLKSFCEKYKINEKLLEEEIYNLPVKYDKKHILKITNFDYFYEKFFKIQKLYDENLETKQAFEQGGSSSNSKHSEIYNEIFNVFSMINFNFITIDRYIYIQEIYSKAFRAIIANYSIVDDKSNEEPQKLSFPVNQFQKLNQFILYLGINGAEKFEQLSAFLNTTLMYQNIEKKKEYKLLEFSDIDNIINVMLSNIRKHENKSQFNNLNLFNKSIIILSWTQLEDNHIKEVLNIFIEILSDITDWSDYEVINIFLTNQYQSIKSDNLKLLEIILDKFILKFIIGNTFIDEQTIKRKNFTDMIFHIFKNNQYVLQISSDRIFTFCSKLPMSEYPEFSLQRMCLIYSLNRSLYVELRNRYIQMLLNDIETKDFEDKEKFMEEINQLLGIEESNNDLIRK